MTPRRILFATMPFDGHFSPLTGLAIYLKELGHDVRWYAGGAYGEKVKKLGLPHYPFVKAQVVNQDNIDSLFPERAKLKGMAKGRFDINQVFLLRASECADDLMGIYQDWPFDLIVQDIAFIGGLFVQDILKVKTVTVGVLPLVESDKNLPPAGLGKQPATNLLGRLLQRLTCFMVYKVVFKPCKKLHNQLRQQYGLTPLEEDFVFDAVVRRADVYLQSGVPNFDYPRKSLSPNVRFVGSLLPYRSGVASSFSQASKTLNYKWVVLVTQGTFERNVEKILVPTLEAYKNDPDTLVIATTGGSDTERLRQRYPQDNYIIEDFIDFDAVMPYVSVYVTNGGYGGVMLALKHRLPIIAAGIQEGKNEIAARIDYAGIGIDLKTETPKPSQIRRAVNRVLTDDQYRKQVRRLGEELDRYQPSQLVEQYINELFAETSTVLV
jgi:UDP:flavonoid glycosyltransferase YjiC (YdhE family)